MVPPVAGRARQDSSTKAFGCFGARDKMMRAEVKAVAALMLQTGIASHGAQECQQERLDLTLCSHPESFISPLQ